MERIRKFLVIVLAPLLGSLGLPSCRRGESDPPVIEKEDVKLEAGLARVCQPGRWNLVRVRVANRGGPFEGHLVVGGVGDDGARDPVSCRLPLEIPRGTTREVSLPVHLGLWSEVTAAFEAEGYRRSFSLPFIAALPDRINLVVASEAAVDFGELAGWMDGAFEGPSEKQTSESGAGNQPNTPLPNLPPCHVAYLAPRSLPSMAPAYDPFALVILQGTALREADPPQLAALERWVGGGGTLIAFPGPEWRAGLTEGLKKLLCISQEPRETAVSKELLIYGAKGGLFADLQPGEGAALTEEGIAIAARKGAGCTVTFRLALEGFRFPGPAQAPRLYEALHPPVSRTLSFAGGAPAGLGHLDGLLPGVLFALSGFHIPGRGGVALALAVYLLLGFLAPAFIFKRLRRREWTFAVVAAAAILAVVAIFRYGLLSGLPGRELEEVTILRAHADGRTAEASSYLGSISPAYEKIALEEPRPAGAEGAGGGLDGARVWPLKLEQQDLYYRRQRGGEASIPATGVEADLSGGLRLPPVLHYPNGMRFFRYDYRLPLDPHLHIEFGRPEAGGEPEKKDALSIALKNPGPEPLSALLFYQEQFSSLQTIAPGAEAALTFSRRKAPGEGRLADFKPVPWYNQPSSDYYLAGMGYSWQAQGSENPLRTLAARPMENHIVVSCLKAVAAPMDPVLAADIWNPGSHRPARALRRELKEEQPAYLIAWKWGAVFPGGQKSMGTRKGMTVIVCELPW
ncbi:MAG: hypothetical protein HY717_01240 [Planctomycetes bacterium]|nr:hypothetical protein [Planctomycetota bacterium]